MFIGLVFAMTFCCFAGLVTAIGNVKHSPQSPKVAAACLSLVMVTALVRLVRSSEQTRSWAAQRSVNEALALNSDIQFPLVLLRADFFKSLGALRPHEELRDKAMLTIFDTAIAAEAFLSE